MVIKSIIGAVGMYLSLLSFTAIGVPMYEINGEDIITGVTGLEVDGEVWDMTLHTGGFDDLFADVGWAAVYDEGFSVRASLALSSFVNDDVISGYVNANMVLGC